VSALRTEYEFVLPKGYLDQNGTLHKRGLMRLATARDELEPLRDPTISSADDPRLTILVLARVVRRLGTLELVTAHEIEGLFAADLAYLQDFYGVINFGTPSDVEAMLEAQEELERAANRPSVPPANEPTAMLGTSTTPNGVGGGAETGIDAPASIGRRAAIEEVPTSAR
jgi:hypothetical protein